jgi:transcriptional accessory protein Tex/SPT6
LATYRPDELGGLDSKTLAKLKRVVDYETKLAAHKERLTLALQRDDHWSDTVAKVLAECTSISQADAIARNLKIKKSAKAFAESDPNIENLGKAILLYQGEPIKDYTAWAAEQTGLPSEQAGELLQKTKRWFQLLLQEDAPLLLQLQRAVLRNASVSVKILPEPSKLPDSDAPSDGVSQPSVDSSSANASGVEASVVADAPAPMPENGTDTVIDNTIDTVIDTVIDNAIDTGIETAIETGTGAAAESTDAVSVETISEVATQAVADVQSEVTEGSIAASQPIESFRKDRKRTKEIKTKSLSDKQLSPRQRRRRWLRNILESYARLKKPVRALTPFQTLMLSRGIRSQIIQLNFQQDLKPLVMACRETLCPGRHPMHGLLMEVAEGGLKELLLPRVQQDVLTILEEDANQELIEAAVEHLEACMLQRPVRGHRILLIDSVGQKTAAVSIIDASGNLLATGDIPCNSSKPDVVTQNVTTLGQWVHEHSVSLIVLTNGHARRYLVHSVAELMKQSAADSLYWTFMDRQGADSYCVSRNSLIELPNISRRHRAAVWLAWRLQDPLRQILKIEPARMRLGSYQRELPQAELEHALQEAISASITKAGVDMYHADEEVLRRVPGFDDATAKRLAEERQKGSLSSRETVTKFLKDSLSEMQTRQAIGFLRVYESEQSLDGTIIHPEDYRLAQRLVAHANLPTPANAPDGWHKPDYEKLAAAKAAAAKMNLDSTASEHVEAFGFESHDADINPNFGEIIDDAAPQSQSSASEEAPLQTEDQADTAEVNVPPADAPPPDATSPDATSPDATSPDATSPDESAEDTAGESTEASESKPDEVVASDASSAEVPAAPTSSRASFSLPEIAVGPMEKPALVVDAEKLARSWQVGRAKLLTVARALQFPFADGRDFQYPVPLRSSVPSLESLTPGTMLSALVIGIADFGVFVELGPDCSGLVHISQLGPEFVEDPHQFVQVGDVIPVWVLHTDENRKRVALTSVAPGTERNTEPRFNQQSDGSVPGNRDSQSGRGPGLRNDRGSRPANNRGAGGRPAGDRPAGDRPAGDRPAGDRPAGAGSRPAGNRPSGPGSRDTRSGGGGRRPDSGRDNRSRDRQSYDRNADRNDSASKPRVKIERPVETKPISEAMQQGKEPLRSFSDLMQFMKKDKSPDQNPAELNIAEQNPASIPSTQSGSADSSAQSANVAAPSNPTASAESQADRQTPPESNDNV